HFVSARIPAEVNSSTIPDHTLPAYYKVSSFSLNQLAFLSVSPFGALSLVLVHHCHGANVLEVVSSLSSYTQARNSRLVRAIFHKCPIRIVEEQSSGRESRPKISRSAWSHRTR